MQYIPERIHILGLGAIGGLFALRLAQAHSVCVVLRSPPAVSAPVDGNYSLHKKTTGRPAGAETTKSTLLHVGYRQSAKLPTVLPVADVVLEWQLADDKEPIENLLIATKSYQVRPALESIRQRINSSTNIVLLQNGLSSQFQLAELLAGHSLFAATTTEAANRQQHKFSDWYSTITHASAGVTRLGSLTPEANRAGCATIQAALNSSGIATIGVTDIWQALWQKFTINCGINAYTAIIGCRNGAITEHEIFNRTIGGLSGELAAIVAAAGYPEAASDIEQRIRKVAAVTGNNISSMLQDISTGRPTEIDAINGFAVYYAQHRGIPVPVNTELTQRVLQLEARITATRQSAS